MSQFVAPGGSKTALFKFILPHVPNLLWHSGAHLLRFSDSSQYWDLKAALTISFLNSVLTTPRNPPETIEQVQRTTTKPTAVAADAWCVPVTYNPSPDFSGEALIRAAIVALGGEEAAILPAPPAELTGEWVSSRSTPDTATPATYPALLADTPEKDVVVLYLHGGAYFLGDPHSHRSSVVRLCRTAKCRAFVPRYRLAPQSPFPGPLLDALVSYLFLLYPPPGSLHTATSADKIVFAGDSAGGGLALCLLLLLQEFQRKGVRIHWYGQEVTAPPPAGVACSSPWCETGRAFGALASFPAGSEDTCQIYDILPSSDGSASHFYLESPAWNKQLRKERGMTQLYAPDALMAHPLVSPLLSEKWEKDTKVYISTGDECLRDSNLYLAHRLKEAGADVRLEWYAGMPHVFPAIVGHLEVAALAWEGMGGFVRHVTGFEEKDGDPLWGAWKWHPKTLLKEIVSDELLKCHGLEFEQVKEMVRTSIVKFRELALANEKEREGAEVVMAKI
jgi:acetyl esterase/lipase